MSKSLHFVNLLILNYFVRPSHIMNAKFLGAGGAIQIYNKLFSYQIMIIYKANA